MVAVVAGVFLLAAVPGDVADTVTLVASVLLLATLKEPRLLPAGRTGYLTAHLSGKVAESVALVALLASTTATVAAT